MIAVKKIPPEDFSGLIGDPKAPRIEKVEDVERVLFNLEMAADRSKPMPQRIGAFLAGQTDLSRGIGRIIDFATIFVPWGDKVNAVRTVVNRKLNPRKMPRLKEKSTKEGIAIVASILAFVGVELDPELISELAGQVIQGSALLIAGITGLIAYFRRERTEDD